MDGRLGRLKIYAGFCAPIRPFKREKAWKIYLEKNPEFVNETICVSYIMEK